MRGYLIGSGWKRLSQDTGQVCGIALPARTASRPSSLPETLFTPATKAEAGDHDENISFDQRQSNSSVNIPRQSA